jgi:hypothetical protein
MTRTKPSLFLQHLIPSLFIFAVSAYPLITGHASFTLGRNENLASSAADPHAIGVNAHGGGAVALGLFGVGLGFVNLAQGLRGRRALASFGLGALLVVGSFGYWIVSFFLPA